MKVFIKVIVWGKGFRVLFRRRNGKYRNEWNKVRKWKSCAEWTHPLPFFSKSSFILSLPGTPPFFLWPLVSPTSFSICTHAFCFSVLITFSLALGKVRDTNVSRWKTKKIGDNFAHTRETCIKTGSTHILLQNKKPCFSWPVKSPTGFHVSFVGCLKSISQSDTYGVLVLLWLLKTNIFQRLWAMMKKGSESNLKTKLMCNKLSPKSCY